MASNDSFILEELRKLEQTRGELPDFLKMYRELLSLQVKAKADTSVAACLSLETAKGRLNQGTPILQFQELDVDWKRYGHLLAQVAKVLRKYDVLSREDAKALEKASEDESLLARTVRSLYETDHAAAPEGIGPGQFGMAAMIALWPFLSRCATELSPLVQKWTWTRNVCPVCGGLPDFGYLEKDEGARWLLCSRCDTAWLYRRLKCPYCGSEDQDDLSYLASEDNLYRLYLCEQCHKYLKVVDLRKTQSEVALPLERLLTLDMDRQAQEMGYVPGHAQAQTSTD